MPPVPSPALSEGTRLGPYEVLAAIGAGGMGEVYRARDTRLDRIVAVKVLSARMAADPELRERFEREARAISSLNHPNICVLHDVGREKPQPGTADTVAVDFLVMEHLEGETLSARIAHGPPRPTRASQLTQIAESPTSTTGGPAPASSPNTPPMAVDEALRIAIQIAEALDRAHRQGIVHRDLKPGNVMLTKTGPVKLLDFGLARLSETSGKGDGRGGKGMVSLAELSAPTMSSPLTMQGQIMGTIQYMSPEQLEGKDIDTRADIFAFGSVLYEMLTGRRAFEGRSQASLIGAILDHDPPPVTSFQKVAPPMLDEIVKRCLAKDREDRWQTARDLKHQLEWVTSGNAAPITTSAPSPPPPADTRAQMLRVGLGIAAGALIAATAVGWVMRPKAPAPAVVARFELDLPTGQAFTRTGRHVVALSPDGARLVYVANSQLYLRAMHELVATPISGTEGIDPVEPVFSPDGQWVAFWSNDQLRKVPVTGGTPVTLCPAENPHGASWSGDRIFLGQGKPRGIIEVAANGGTPRLLVSVDEKRNEWAHGPQLVAGGRAMLFTLRTGQGSWEDATIVVQDLSTGQRTVLVNGGRDAKVLPSGHLVYSRDGTLFAMPFDDASLSTTGGAAPVQEEVRPADGLLGAMQIAFSASGSVALIPGTGIASWELAWVDRQGREERLKAPARNYGTFTGSAPFDVSPDGTKVAVRINETGSPARPALPTAVSPPHGESANDIWIFDIPRGTLTRLTFSGNAGYPVWTPEGRRVCYAGAGEESCQAADGTGTPQLLVKVEGLTALRSFSPDGKQAVLSVVEPKTGADVVTTTVGPPVETRPLIQTPYTEHGGALSPDGRFLAYASNETGRFEVYVRPFPSVDQGRWQISIEGGAEPRWAKNGRELYFSNFGALGLRPAEPAILSVAIQPGSAFIAGRPAVVVKRPESAAQNYDVAPDGRFLFTVPPKSAVITRTKLIVVQNWFDELRSRVPVASSGQR